MHFTSDYDFSPLTAAKQKRIMFCSLFNDSIRPTIGTSTEPIFIKFAGLVELWP